MRVFFLLAMFAFGGATLSVTATEELNNDIKIHLTSHKLIVKNGETTIGTFTGRDVLKPGLVESAFHNGEFDLLCSGTKSNRRCAVKDPQSSDVLDWVVFGVKNGSLSKL